MNRVWCIKLIESCAYVMLLTQNSLNSRRLSYRLFFIRPKYTNNYILCNMYDLETTNVQLCYDVLFTTLYYHIFAATKNNVTKKIASCICKIAVTFFYCKHCKHFRVSFQRINNLNKKLYNSSFFFILTNEEKPIHKNLLLAIFIKYNRPCIVSGQYCRGHS